VGRYGGRRYRLAVGEEDEETARGYVCEKICVCEGLDEEGAFVVEEEEEGEEVVDDDWGGLVAVDEDDGRRRFGRGRMGRVPISEAGRAYSVGGSWSRVWAWWWWGATAVETAAAVEVMLSPLSDFKSTSASPRVSEQIDWGNGGDECREILSIRSFLCERGEGVGYRVCRDCSLPSSSEVGRFEGLLGRFVGRLQL
jgi:hypothetical protein